MLSKDTLVSLLGELTSAQESIEQVSAWLQQYKEEAADAAIIWKSCFLEASKDKKLNLLYLVNDVIQHSKRKAPQFVEAFGHILPKCLSLCRDHEQKSQIQRMLDIWESRELFQKHVISAMKYNIDDIGMLNAPVDLPDLMKAVDQLGELESLSADVLTKLSIRLDATDFANAFSVTSRKEGNKYASDFDETASFLEQYCDCLSNQSKKRIEMLQKVNSTLYQLEKDEEALNHLDRECKFKQSELVRTRKAISAQLLMVDEGMVDFGDDSPNREEIENLTSEEEDVDIEGIEASANEANKPRKEVLGSRNNGSSNTQHDMSDDIHPEDAIDEQQPQYVEQKKPKRQQKKLPSYEPRKILSYGFRLDAPPNNEQPVGFLLLPDGTVCPAPIAHHMFLAKPTTPKSSDQEIEEKNGDKETTPGPKTPEGSEPEEGEVSESDDEKQDVPVEDVDGEPFDILEDGYISDDKKPSSSVGSAPSMPSPEVSDEEDPQASALKNVSYWKQEYGDPEGNEPEYNEPDPQHDEPPELNNDGREEIDEEVPDVTDDTGRFKNSIPDEDVHEPHAANPLPEDRYGNYYPASMDNSSTKILTRKPAYLVTSNRNTAYEYRENRPPSRGYHGNVYDEDSQSHLDHPMVYPPPRRGFRHDSYPPSSGMYQNPYPPAPGYHHPVRRTRPQYTRPAYLDTEQSRPQRQPSPNHFLWESPRVIQAIPISGGLIRLLISFYGAASLIVWQNLIQLARLTLKLQSIRGPSKWDKLLLNGAGSIHVFMFHGATTGGKSYPPRPSQPLSNISPISSLPPAYLPSLPGSVTSSRDAASRGRDTYNLPLPPPPAPPSGVYGPPIPTQVHDIKIQKYASPQQVFGPPIPPRINPDKTENYSMAVQQYEESAKMDELSDMSESGDDEEPSDSAPFSNIPKAKTNFYSKSDAFSDIPPPKIDMSEETGIVGMKNFKPFNATLLTRSTSREPRSLQSFPKAITGSTLPGFTSIDSILSMYSLDVSDSDDSDIDASGPSILQSVFGGEQRGCPKYESPEPETTEANDAPGELELQNKPSVRQANADNGKKLSKSQRRTKARKAAKVQKREEKQASTEDTTNTVTLTTSVPSLNPPSTVNLPFPAINFPIPPFPVVGGMMPPFGMGAPPVVPPFTTPQDMPFSNPLPTAPQPCYNAPVQEYQKPATSQPTPTNQPPLQGEDLEEARKLAKERVMKKIAELKAENEKEKIALLQPREKVKITVSHEEIKARLDELNETAAKSVDSPAKEANNASSKFSALHPCVSMASPGVSMAPPGVTMSPPGIGMGPPGVPLPLNVNLPHIPGVTMSPVAPRPQPPFRPTTKFISPSQSSVPHITSNTVTTVKPSIVKPAQTRIVANHRLILPARNANNEVVREPTALAPTSNFPSVSPSIPTTSQPVPPAKPKVTNEQMEKVMKLKAKIDASCKMLLEKKVVPSMTPFKEVKKSRFDMNPAGQLEIPTKVDRNTEMKQPPPKKARQDEPPSSSVDLDDIDNLVDFSQADVDLEF